ITVLPKPGKDHGEAAGWRPIALLNFLSKVYASLLYLKIAGPIGDIMSENQAGFRTMQHYKMPQHTQDRFWALYNGHSFAVKRDGATSSKTETKTGTKQGCLLSPIIFNLCFQYVLERV
ncbi:unnamed protein product, partial [Amoebophrya sp. A120]